MFTLLKEFLAPVLSIFFSMLGSGYFVSFVSVRLHAEGVSDLWIGLIQGGYYFGLLLAVMKIEMVIHRIGHIRALAAFASLLSITILMQALWLEPFYWFVLRFIAGVCLAALFVVVETWLIVKGSPSERGTVLSIYMIGIYVAQAGGQLFLEVFPYLSIYPYLIAAIFVSLGVLPLALTRTEPPTVHEPTFMSWKELMRKSPFGFAGCLVGGLILGAIYSFLPLFAAEHLYPVGVVMSVTIFGGLMLQWPIGRLSDYFDRRNVLLMVAIITLAPALLLMLDLFPYYAVLLLCFLLGGFTFTIYPLGIAQVVDHVQSSEITKVTCMLLFVYGLGATFGPPLSSVGIQATSSVGLFGYILLVTLLLIFVGTYSSLFRPKVPAEKQKPYQVMTRITPVIYLLDPRKKSKPK